MNTKCKFCKELVEIDLTSDDINRCKCGAFWWIERDGPYNDEHSVVWCDSRFAAAVKWIFSL